MPLAQGEGVLIHLSTYAKTFLLHAFYHISMCKVILSYLVVIGDDFHAPIKDECATTRPRCLDILAYIISRNRKNRKGVARLTKSAINIHNLLMAMAPATRYKNIECIQARLSSTSSFVQINTLF